MEFFHYNFRVARYVFYVCTKISFIQEICIARSDHTDTFLLKIDERIGGTIYWSILASEEAFSLS